MKHCEWKLPLTLSVFFAFVILVVVVGYAYLNMASGVKDEKADNLGRNVKALTELDAMSTDHQDSAQYELIVAAVDIYKDVYTVIVGNDYSEEVLGDVKEELEFIIRSIERDRPTIEKVERLRRQIDNIEKCVARIGGAPDRELKEKTAQNLAFAEMGVRYNLRNLSEEIDGFKIAQKNVNNEEEIAHFKEKFQQGFEFGLRGVAHFQGDPPELVFDLMKMATIGLLDEESIRRQMEFCHREYLKQNVQVDQSGKRYFILTDPVSDGSMLAETMLAFITDPVEREGVPPEKLAQRQVANLSVSSYSDNFAENKDFQTLSVDELLPADFLDSK